MTLPLRVAVWHSGVGINIWLFSSTSRLIALMSHTQHHYVPFPSLLPVVTPQEHKAQYLDDLKCTIQHTTSLFIKHLHRWCEHRQLCGFMSQNHNFMTNTEMIQAAALRCLHPNVSMIGVGESCLSKASLTMLPHILTRCLHALTCAKKGNRSF